MNLLSLLVWTRVEHGFVRITSRSEPADEELANGDIPEKGINDEAARTKAIYIPDLCNVAPDYFGYLGIARLLRNCRPCGLALGSISVSCAVILLKTSTLQIIRGMCGNSIYSVDASTAVRG